MIFSLVEHINHSENTNMLVKTPEEEWNREDTAPVSKSIH